ncbi:MAG: deoxyribonuclease IV [Trueperaceae bacterium]|nr:deoxyribonuclease IV [Trueperaceae bacterium]
MDAVSAPASNAGLRSHLRLGANVLVAGGLHKAWGRAERLGCDTMQIFVKNPNRWSAPPLTDEQVALYHEEAARYGLEPVIAHASYLINLASPKPDTLAKSRAALADELSRASRLGVAGLVVHPGAHTGDGVASGIARVAQSVDAVLAEVGDALGESETVLLLETMAGQGTTLGRSFEELAMILEQVAQPERVGICFDTCHVFAAGYPLADEAGYEATWTAFEAVLGRDKLGCIHVNDSRHPLGSHKDRHANVGVGEIGIEGFWRLVNDERLARRALPLLLETPLGDAGDGHARDLARLRELRGAVAIS